MFIYAKIYIPNYLITNRYFVMFDSLLKLYFHIMFQKLKVWAILLKINDASCYCTMLYLLTIFTYVTPIYYKYIKI